MINLRPMKRSDLPKVRNLYRNIYGNNRQEENDTWRFLSSESGITPTTIAEERGEMVGAYPAWLIRMNLGGEVVQGAQAMDIMVDPGHQGKGIFTLMGEEAFEELAKKYDAKMLYGIPNKESYVGHMRKMSWHHVTDVPRYIRPILPLSLVPYIPGFLKKPIHFFLEVLFKPRAPLFGVEILERIPSEKDMRQIIEEAAAYPKYACRLHRDARWFKWRYDAKSDLGYRWLVAKQGKETVGFCVYRNENMEGGAKITRIAELWGNKTATGALLKQVIRLSYKNKSALIMILTNMPFLRLPLLCHLFLGLQKKPLIVRALTPKSLAANIHNPENWYIMSGDFDAM
jgi:hypothetical protein